MDSQEPPSNGVPRAVGEERAGEGHTVTRRKVERPITFEHVPEDQDFGQLSNEQSFQDMRALAKEYADKIEVTYEGKVMRFDVDFLQQVADSINEDFNFTIQGSGTATLPKQLERYKNSRQNFKDRQATSEEKRELRKLLDCKLATTMTGLVLSELAQKRNVLMKVDIASINRQDPHPRLKITISDGGTTQSFSIDFRVQVGENEQTGQKYDHYKDWHAARDHSESVATASEIKQPILEAFDKKYPIKSSLFDSNNLSSQEIALQTLQTLDDRFIKA